jgi:hypothetical protein
MTRNTMNAEAKRQTQLRIGNNTEDLNWLF